MHRALFLLTILVPLCPAAFAEPIQLPDEPVLLVDDQLIESMKGTSLKLHSPVRQAPVITYDAPWEGGQSGYVSLVQDGRQIRMYYRGGGDLGREYTCVALSSDGLSFERPKLGLFEFEGSKDNNIIWTGPRKGYSESHNFFPFIDGNPACKPDERYKAVSVAKVEVGSDTIRALLGFVSADGLRWRKLCEQPIITEGSFDSQNVAFWDIVRKEYVCYSRIGRDGKRSVNRCTSKDFVTWSKAEFLDFGSSPTEHFYTNGIVQYWRAPHLYIGMPMRFVHPVQRNTVGLQQRPTDGLSDAVFIASHDGLHWSRAFMEAWIRPGPDPANWGGAHGNQTPAWGVLQTGPAEMSVYWADHYDNYPKKDAIPRLFRGTLRLDGFVSVNAPYGGDVPDRPPGPSKPGEIRKPADVPSIPPRAGGEFLTKPLVFKGKTLVLNYSTSAPGSIRVELQDAAGKPLPGFALDDCIEIWGDEIERTVAWRKSADLSALAGKPVKLRFVMSDADIYSIQFK